MKNRQYIVTIGLFALTCALSHQQSLEARSEVAKGIEEGSEEGEEAAGPVGAIVGGILGAGSGAVKGSEEIVTGRKFDDDYYDDLDAYNSGYDKYSSKRYSDNLLEHRYDDEPIMYEESNTAREIREGTRSGEEAAGTVGGVVGGILGAATGLVEDTGEAVTGRPVDIDGDEDELYRRDIVEENTLTTREIID